MPRTRRSAATHFLHGHSLSQRPARHFHECVARLLIDQSLTIALALTGAAWVVLYSKGEWTAGGVR